MIRISESEIHGFRKLEHSDFRYNMHQAIAFSLSVNEDGSDTVTYYGEAWIDPSSGSVKPHWVYVMVNPSIPGICKIGYTTKSAIERVKELNSSSGVIVPWYPVFSYKCGNGAILESEVHNELENLGFRVNNKREGFNISSQDAISIIEKIGEKYKTK